jgi:hypothetical protein
MELVNNNSETKIDIAKPRNEIVKQRSLREIEDGVLHDGERYLYKPDEEFKSCCFSCDKPLCLHISKMFVSVAVLFFCMFMLQDKANSAEFYTGTIAGLLGHYLNNSIPQSQPPKKSKND